MKSILQATNLSIGYSRKKQQNLIASGIDIDLRERKLIGLIGANGIGKSTLLRTLCGIQKPLHGELMLDRRPIGDYNPMALAKQLSVVLTEKLPPGNLTVYDLIALGRQPYTNWVGKLTDADRAQVQLAMELTNTAAISTKKHFEISDGQLQNVLIARAIAQDTPIIILDEPSTHLDLSRKAALFSLLRNLSASTGKCILFSTHDIEPAIELCDELIVMTTGSVVQDSPENLIRRGVLNTIFDAENVRFDAETRKFVYKTL